MCTYPAVAHTQATQSHEFLKTILHKPIHCGETALQKIAREKKKYLAKLGQFALNYIVYLFIYSKGGSVGTAANIEMQSLPLKTSRMRNKG